MTISVNDGGPRTDTLIRQGHLAGPSRPLDRRINAIRDDLADATLAGIVTAPRYAEGVYRRCAVTATMMHGAPDDEATAVSQLLYGEVFIVFEIVGHGADGWAWGQGLHDRYTGWIRLAALVPEGPSLASHVVGAAAATVFAAADIKARAIASLPMNARLSATSADRDFIAAAGGFVHRRQLRPIAASTVDPAGLATGFIGSPYLWGGRTRDGIDCSGLTQAVLRACGVFCPRDSDQQAAAFPAIDPADRRRGDLVVFPGHIGILADATTLIHATAFWMTTVTEPLAAVIGRLPVVAFHRPPDIVATPC